MSIQRVLNGFVDGKSTPAEIHEPIFSEVNTKCLILCRVVFCQTVNSLFYDTTLELCTCIAYLK